VAADLGLHLDDALMGPINKAWVCTNRHAGTLAWRRPALTWLGTDGSRETWTFAELTARSNQFANVLVSLGVQPGQRVFIFLERIPELFVAVLGALKMGAVVGPLFAAFGPEAIRDRMFDCQARVLVTSPSLKPRLDEVRHELPDLQEVILVNRHPGPAEIRRDGCLDWEPLMSEASDIFEPVPTLATDASVIHYTSGTTGKPKGAQHIHRAILVQAETARVVLDLQPDTDRYWCTADPGWVTGTAYGIFGPWALGCAQMVYEGPFSPTVWYDLIQRERIGVWYTSPTAIRMLMKAGNDLPAQFDLSSLRHLASVGEPLNPEALQWGRQVFGGLSFVDTWWQTETGGMQITNRPGLDIRPGSMGQPIAGVRAAILDASHAPLPVGEEGHLALCPEGIPSMFKGYWGREDLTQSRYVNGWYLTGDRAREDEDGYFWFIGRADDVINTAGHLVGPFEVESALIEHPAVAEAGVIGKPDPDRMEIVKAFVALKTGVSPSDALKAEIQQFVRTRLAAHAYPREIDFIDNLPKTRSGKIMRRLLKARELGLPEGDLSTLEPTS
jgi:acetyl-CoA synthetase